MDSLSISAELVSERDAVSALLVSQKVHGSCCSFARPAYNLSMRGKHFRICTFLITLSGEAFRRVVVNSGRGRSTLRPRKLDQSAALACFAFATIDSMLSPSPFATPVP
jgi:hypothetical protein